MLKVNKNNQNKVFETFLNLTLPWLMFALGIWFFCLRILGLDLSYIPGDMIDSRFINYVLEHAHRWVSGYDHHFWDAGFMFPFENPLALSDNMLGAVCFYSIWRCLGFEMETSFQLWWLTVCILNYWICFIVLRKLKLKQIASSLGAWIFAFGLFNLGQINHMQMMVRFGVPIIFYSAYMLVNTGNWKYLLMYSIAILFQLSSVLYTGIYALYFSILFIIIYSWHSKQQGFINSLFDKKQKWLVVFIGITTIITLMAFMWPYQKMSSVVGLRLFKEVAPYVPEIGNWFFPHESTLIWKFLIHYTRPESQAFWLLYAFPGITVLLTLFGAFLYLFLFVFKKVQLAPLTFSIIATAIIMFVLHLKIYENITLYAIIFKLPGINSIRIPIRFMHVELFLLVFLFALFINNWKWHQHIILVVILFFDHGFNPSEVPRINKTEWIARREYVKHKLDPQKPSPLKPLALIDTTQQAALTHLDAMIYAQQEGLKTVNGYSGYCHDQFGDFFNKANQNGLDKWLNYSKIKNNEIWIVK